jgi:RimJ/RimL family protein N-acetyltransferase
VESSAANPTEPPRAWSPGQPAQFDTPAYRLRSLTKADATDRFRAWMEDAEVQRYLNSAPTTTTAQALGLHIEAFDNRTAFLIGIFDRAADLHVGFYSVYCDLLNGSAESLAVVGDRSYWGKKVVAATRPALLDFLFDRVGMEKVWGRPLARDFAGIHSFLQLGFRCEGILRSQLRAPDGSRSDQYFFGMLRREWRARRRGAKS